MKNNIVRPPIISVVVPIYNTEKYLAQCLETIVNQTFCRIEIICIDDGSTDGSWDILEMFASQDERITAIHRKTSSGSAAVPRNTGLDQARGKYIIFLDSDDYFDLTMLEKLYTHAEKTSADLVMCDNYSVSFIDDSISTKYSSLHKSFLPELEVFSYKDIPNTIFQMTSGVPWSKLILLETLVKHGLKFQINVPILDDMYFMNLLLVLSKRITIVQDRLIYYRMDRYGAQSTKVEKHKDSIFLAYFVTNEHLMKLQVYEIVKLSLQNWTLSMMLWWAYAAGDYESYSGFCDIYLNEYFPKLNLLDLDFNEIYDSKVRRFYEIILGHNSEPSFREIMEEVLKPNSKIALYGAGTSGKNIYKLVSTHGKHEVVVWCDRNADKLSEFLDNPLINHPKYLMNYDFDAVLITILDQDIMKEVKKDLVKMGVKPEKIYVI